MRRNPAFPSGCFLANRLLKVSKKSVFPVWRGTVVVFILSFFLCIKPTYAEPVYAKHITDAKHVGSGTLSVVFWDVYDVTLIAPEGQWQQDKPYALELDYLREIEGHDIADRSAEEIRQLGFEDEVELAAWHAQMKDIFPDVRKGSRLTGVYAADKTTYFYDRNKEIGVIRDPDFGRWFFGIWLSEETSEPSLRRKLLGL